MLIWIIFLVLSAVVLTILGVGMLDMYGKARIEKKKMIKEGAVAGRYKDGVISIADVIRLPNNQYHVLNDLEKEVVKYHERFHEIASKLGYEQAEREDYADLAATYALILEGDVKTAKEGINFLEKTGRKDSINDISISAINKVLSGNEDKLTKDEEEKFASGMSKTGNLINKAYGILSTEEHGLSEKYHMSINPAIEGTKGSIKSILKYFVDAVPYLYKQSREVESGLKGGGGGRRRSHRVH